MLKVFDFLKKKSKYKVYKLWKTKTKKSFIDIFLTKMKQKNWKSFPDWHISVLLYELAQSVVISPSRKNTIIDATLWMGWHAREVLKKMNKWDMFIWFDVDKRNLDIIAPVLQQEWRDSGIDLIFINDNFVNIKKRLEHIWIEEITWVYYDLWLSSLHIDIAQRWFSFQNDGPLDMRFDTSVWITAGWVLSSYDERKLAQIFWEYGEEPLGKKIAQVIKWEQKKWVKLSTTWDLVKLIEKVSKHPKVKARIFQAIRIEVNHEMQNLKTSLSDAIEILQAGWSIWVISFHSLEDRIVKNIFKESSKDCICQDIICTCQHKKSLEILTKKPISPTMDEIKKNPRSRSAKLRLWVKFK